MATIGLDKLYYSKITEDSNGQETYSTPLVLAKAITAELSVELVEAILYADDGAAEVVKDFNSGKLTLGVDDIGPAAAADLTGASTDDNGVLVSASENVGKPVAVGFRAQKANGSLPAISGCTRVKFGPARDQPADQVGFHHLFHAYYRRNCHAPEQAGRLWQAPVEIGGYGG